jgi:2-methylisocitrate lyase-like PEP mutase family enzyme
MSLTPAAAALRRLLDAPGEILVPCCHDGLSARLAKDAGFAMTFLSGFEAAAMAFGVTDTGYLTLSDLVEQMRRVARAAPGFPAIADAETGYGSAANVRYTVFEFARAGAAAVMIEDQVWPRRCPFLGGSNVIGREEARLRMRAAIEACREAGILLLARTDARSSIGFAEALSRIRMYQDDGADMVVAEGLESAAEMRDFCKAARVPTIQNQLPGIRTPFLGLAGCRAIGLKMIAYHPMMPRLVPVMQAVLKSLRDTGTYGEGPLMGPRDVARILDYDQYLAIEKRFAPPA